MKVSTLDQRHPSFKPELLADIAALYEGGDLWHGRLAVFMPQRELESDPAYAERSRRAVYENNVAPIIDLMIGWLFEAPAIVTGLPDDWTADVDGQGTSWSTWWRDIVTNAAKDGRAFAWINFPKPPDVAPTSRAEEDALGLSRPRLVSVPAAMVPNWIDDETGALSAVMIRDVCVEQATLVEPQRTVYRWTAIDEVGISRWEWTPRTKDGAQVPAPDDDAGEGLNIAHNRPDLPVVRLVLPAGLHIGGKLRDPAVELAGLANDLNWALHRGAHALMVVASEDGTRRPALGAGAYLQVGPNDSVTFAEPTGACYAALASRIEVSRQGIYRTAHQMGASVGKEGAGASGASKDLDWKALEIVLDAYADVVRGAMKAVALRLADVFRVAPDKITVTGLDGWDEGDLQAMLASAQLAAPLVKSETFRREVAKATAAGFLVDVAPGVLETVNKELDDADYSEQPGFAPTPPPEPKPPPGDPVA